MKKKLKRLNLLTYKGNTVAQMNDSIYKALTTFVDMVSERLKENEKQIEIRPIKRKWMAEKGER